MAPSVDGAQEFVAQLSRLLRLFGMFKRAGKRLRDDPLVAAPVFTEQQAELFGFDHACGATRFAVVHQCFCDVAGHPLLIGEAVSDGVDQAGDPSEAVQTTSRQVGDMCYAAKGNEMVRTDAMNGNSANHHHIAAMIGETLAQRFGGIKVISAEQALLPKFANPLCRSSHVFRVRGNAAGAEQIAHRALERYRVECLPAGNSDIGLRDGGGMHAVRHGVFSVSL